MRTMGTLFVAGTFVLACSSKTGSGTGTTKADGSPALGGGGSGASAQRTGGTSGAGGIVGSGGTTAMGGGTGQGGAIATGGATVTPDATSADGSANVAATDLPLTKPDSATVQDGAGGTGGTTATGGSSGTGGKGTISGSGGTLGTGGSGAAPGCTGAAGSGPIGTISGELATGIVFKDTDGKLVNAHGGGIIQVCDTFYMHGEYFLSTTTDNNFNGFSMYSSKDLATWKNEGIILPQQASGELGPNRKGERPHIIKCPSTGEFVLYAHAADSTYQVDKEVVYATSPSVNGKYTYKGPLTNASGMTASHSDMSAYADETGAYVITESGHVYTLASDCHSWLSDKSVAVNCTSGGSESPTVFKAGGIYYWIGSNKTGWRANNNFYSTVIGRAHV